jgi:acyl carrier protein
VLFSSISAIVGEFGQADYCAANIFLDAFAYRNTSRNYTFTVSINWDTWRDVGMAVNTVVPPELRQMREQETENGISPAEGTEVFSRILAQGTVPQIIVSTRDLQIVSDSAHTFTRSRILEALEETQTARPAHPRANLSTSYVAPETELEKTIAQVWQSVLGIDRVGIRDNFFELGGNSLSGIQIIAQLERALAVRIPPIAVFESTTIHMLAQMLDPQGSEKTAYQERQSRGEERRNRILERRKRRS